MRTRRLHPRVQQQQATYASLPRYYRRPRLHFRSQHQTFLFLRLPKTRRAATPASSDPMSRSTAAAALDPRPRFPDASIPRRCLLLAIIRRHTANATYQLQPFSCLGRTAPTRPDQTRPRLPTLLPSSNLSATCLRPTKHYAGVSDCMDRLGIRGEVAARESGRLDDEPRRIL